MISNPDQVAPDTPASSRRLTLWVGLLLAAVGLLVVAARCEGMPTATFLEDHLSLEYVDDDVGLELGQLLLVPLGCLIVVFFRLTLGVSMLGPFRPILIAVAIAQTGLLIGASLTVFMMVIVALVRPQLQGAALPYFSRLTLLLSLVVLIQVALVMTGEVAAWEGFLRVAFFPVVVLCLTAEGFARVLARDGLRPATWRGVATLGIAVVIDGVFAIPGCRDFLVAYPELVLVEIAGVLLLSAFGNFRLLERWWAAGSRAPQPHL